MSTDINTLLQNKKIVELERNLLPSDFDSEFYAILDALENHDGPLRERDTNPEEVDPVGTFLGKGRLAGYLEKGEDLFRNENGRFKTFRSTELHRRLLPYIMEMLPKHSISNTGNIIYKPGNFMGWHTNSDFEGCRLYFTHCDKDHESFFRYYDSETQEIVTLWDKEGINIRLFRVGKEDPLWHCVWSNCTRISLGYFILDNLV